MYEKHFVNSEKPLCLDTMISTNMYCNCIEDGESCVGVIQTVVMFDLEKRCMCFAGTQDQMNIMFIQENQSNINFLS